MFSDKSLAEAERLIFKLNAKTPPEPDVEDSN